MRSRVVFSLALGLLAADSAVAGLCKPPQSSKFILRIGVMRKGV